MPSRVRPSLIDRLPPLAWGLVSRPAETEAEIVHGRSVVVGDGFVAEGTWNAPCDRIGYLSASARFGSGVHWGGGSAIEVRGAMHPLERIWVLERTEGVAVSNSLPLVLALGHSGLDPTFPHYEADLLWFTEGPAEMSRRVRTVDGATLRQYGEVILSVDSGRIVAIEPDRSLHGLGGFDSFAGYRAHLSRELAALFDNAADPRRPRSYTPLATLSSGYDSPACAVIAREQGASEAMTFPLARASFADTDDDGSRIAEALGYSVTALDRFGYKQGDGTAERWALAGGAGGEDVTFASMDGLPGRCLVSGYSGDAVWDRSMRFDVLQGKYPGAGGLGLSEYRIHRDFVHVALPNLDLFRLPQMVALSNSAEMGPWMMGGGYDRPVPRRIIEEAGVPRGSFGELKKVTSAPFYYEDGLGAFGPAALQAFSEWVAGLDDAPNWGAYQRRHRLLQPWRRFGARIADVATRHPVPEWLVVRTRPRIRDRWRRPGHDSLLVATWAIETTREECLEQLGEWEGLRGP